jgi:nitroreductase
MLMTHSVLTTAARAAGRAPSIHNTQPWRWRIGSDLELYADRSRQLSVTDREGRLLMLSCGAALNHAVTALAADGWRADVERLPDPSRPDLLARVSPGEWTPVEPDAQRRLAAMGTRYTDRRPVSDRPVDAAAVARLAQVVHAAGARLHVLDRNQVIDLAAAAAHAQATQALDPEWRAELEYWAGRDRSSGSGVPVDVIPADEPQTTVPARDFGASGALPVGSGHDDAAVYAILYGDDDTPVSWLRAGEALSAAWLTATELDVTVLPMSAVVEVIPTREELRRLLGHVGFPYLVVRLGRGDPDRAMPPSTPRLPLEQIVEVIDP